jgi:hypothetical protein
MLIAKSRKFQRSSEHVAAFISGGDVLYVDIMSQSTLKEMPRHLDASRSTNTRQVYKQLLETPQRATQSFWCNTSRVSA